LDEAVHDRLQMNQIDEEVRGIMRFETLT